MEEYMPPLVCIVGQTATGKSALGLKVAQQWNGEIICADSWTVRRGIDIGTAKPTVKEQQLIPHHLLDIIDPDATFNAALFKSRANQAIKDITARGKLPIMVGGTGLYVDSVIYDYDFAPVTDRQERTRLDSLSLSELSAQIKKAGLDTSGVDMRNKRRLVRLIESNGTHPGKQSLRQRTLLLGIHIDKTSLRELVTRRTDNMLASGLEDEVRQLAKRYGWGHEALKGIGYAQWNAYFLGSASHDEVRQKIIRDTMDLAKRQQTWFQRNKSIQWFTPPVDWAEVVDIVTTFLNNNIP